MAKQLLIDAYRGKRTERAPWVPYAGVHAAYLIGEKADKFFQDPNLIAKGVLYAAERYKADGVPLETLRPTGARRCLPIAGVWRSNNAGGGEG